MPTPPPSADDSQAASGLWTGSVVLAGFVAGVARSGAGDPNVIASPIAGTVQKVFVTKGMHVEGKTPVVLLDAMKMDTYIYAPRSGGSGIGKTFRR